MSRHTPWIAAVVFVLIAALPAPSDAQAQAAYVAATWGDDAVHLLDSGLNDLSSFPAGAGSPNGITTDGTLIYTGHFGTQEVIAYDFTGAEQFRWSATIPNLQGMTLAGAELVIAQSSELQFYNPATGALLRTIPSPEAGSVEGLTSDGTTLWVLGSQAVYSVNPADGTVLTTLPNAASGCSYGGTGITRGAPGELVLACSDGTWYRVSATDGSVIASGNNGLSMYGIEAAAMAAQQPIPVSGPLGTALLVVLLAAAGLAILGRVWM